MDVKLITSLLKSRYKSEKMNTNNAWGFGGAIKTRYYLKDDLFVDIGFACYRHLPSQTFINIKDDGGNILCEGKEDVSAFLTKINFLNKDYLPKS